MDPTFIGMMDEVKTLLQYAFQTKNELTFAVSAPGSAGMEYSQSTAALPSPRDDDPLQLQTL
jgi:aspartate aminotransferase-like enzyme